MEPAHNSKLNVMFWNIYPFVDQVYRTSKKVCHKPGFSFEIDDMMIQYVGRSVETHRMKNKPIN